MPTPDAQTVVDLLPDGVVIADADGTVTVLSRVAAALLGVTACGWLSPPVSLEPAPPPTAAPAAPTIEQRGARWVAAAWADLPGWTTERPLEAWGALRRSCERMAPEMQRAWAQSERPSEMCFLLRPVSRIYPPNQFDAVICQAICSATQLGAARCDWPTAPLHR